MAASSSKYLVCATPRSGSTLLCESLRATGVAGVPLEHFEVLRHSGRPRQPREYFSGVDAPEVLSLLPHLAEAAPDIESTNAWWRRIEAAGTSPNGVWGGKLMWGHVEDVVQRAHQVNGLADADLDLVVRELLGDRLRLVFVTRPDKVAQAVSLWRAVQTQTWRAANHGSADGARYAFAGIDHLVAQLEQHDASWRQFFTKHGWAPYEVTYDALASDPRGVVAAVLRELGLPDDGVPAPPLRRQADERSAEWAARYRAERTERGRC